RPAGPHAADVQGEDRPDGVPARLEVVRDQHVHRRRDLEAVAALEAERLARPLGGEEEREPAVADLEGEADVLRAERGEIDGDLRPERSEHQLERLAEARRVLAAIRNLVLVSRELD